MRTPFISLIALLVVYQPLPVCAADPDTAALKPFMEKHCVECHDADAQKGGVRLDTLSSDFASADLARQWVDVFDKVASGEMPPKKQQPKPPESDRLAFLSRVKSALTAAELSKRHTDGRVVLRRLNRTEYENTVRDLLGVEVDLKDLLPEDNSALGFDNVAAAMSVSSVLLERYLEAADVALDAAIVSGPKPVSKIWSVSYGPATENPKDFRLKRGVRLEPDGTFLIFNSGDLLSQGDRFRAPVEGRYHFRVPMSSWHSNGKPLVVSVLAGSFSQQNPRKRTVGFYDVPADQPRVFEFDEYLPKGGTIKVMAQRMPRKSLDKEEERAVYAGPGVAVGKMEIEGPIYPNWPPEGHRRLFADLDLKQGTLKDAEAVLRRFLPRAFRRAVSEPEMGGFLTLVQRQLEGSKTFEEAIRAGLKAALCSRQFLFLTEQPEHLDAYAVASRLSYFLWSTAPDAELFKLAAAGTLTQPKVLHAQVERLLNDARAARFTEDFTGQWLGLRQIEFTLPDKRLYPDFDDLLQWSMLEETHAFFDELLHKDLSLLNFVHSDFSMLNARLAEHYGIAGVDGTPVRRVALPAESPRGGVLGQAAVLKVTANGTNTSPVVRGAWVMRNLVGRPPKPPPPNVPAVEPDTRGATTLREQLEKHRSLGQCSSCHAKIDPAGNALESFDVIGGWRENYRTLGGTKTFKIPTADGRNPSVRLGPKVDPSDHWLNGEAFTGVKEFEKLLLKEPDQVARCMTEKLMVYATGAGLDFIDRPAVDGVIQRAKAKGYGFRSLVHEVVASEVFLNK